jgi:NAD(P)-dependent dehydrogenase (short-subunit alcohol dehydrogenase family)
VLIHGRHAQAVQAAVDDLSIADGPDVTGFAGDLADRRACDHLVESCGDIDVLVNCAGILETATVEASGEDLWHRVMDVNVTAPWRLARGFLPGLRRRHGVIVNVSSDAGLLGYSQNTVYCASKGALIGLTRALAVELSGDVRVLGVCPGPVDTDMMRSAVARESDPEAARRSWASGPMLERVASPDEIAGAIVYAASSDCSFATGNLIVVDGGTTAGRRM